MGVDIEIARLNWGIFSAGFHSSMAGSKAGFSLDQSGILFLLTLVASPTAQTTLILAQAL